ncbi:MAG: endolytic transglycosylase MltG, partial [Alphaproteobacteria bacterium]|nr:endolytic transglycosylase MltG [Alphaproteobacteria bacterium]
MKKKLMLLIRTGIVSLTILFLALFYHSDLRKGKTVRISNGATFSGITQHLRERHIIYSTLLFKSLVYAMGESHSLKSGTYFFPARSSLWTIYHTLTTGQTTFARVTIPEGFSVKQAIERLEANPDISGECPQDIQEGSLLPETYFFEPMSSCSALVSQMKRMMDRALDETWETRDLNLPLKDKNDFLTLASIVEKETGIEEERPLVAS